MSNNEFEKLITLINTNVFFKEFTFDKNDFYPDDGKKELADNVIWLDELLFVIQTKERDSAKAQKSTDAWFKNKILKKAKKQIKDTIQYLKQYDSIKITNRRNQSIDISKVNQGGINKIIIYKPDEYLSEENRNIKFYESQDEGNIHIFHFEDYFHICKYLITPMELEQYLKFRERIYLRHKEIIKVYPEQYILGHFLNTEDETTIKEEYIETLLKMRDDKDDFDMSFIIDDFKEKIIEDSQKNSLEYYSIIKEIAKLKRYELFEFKKRFQLIIEDVKLNRVFQPRRFTMTSTKCGFVFISLLSDKIQYWENGLLNFTMIYKYKRKLNKCLGVIIFKKGECFDIKWAFINEAWKYNSKLEEAVKRESEFYKKVEYKEIIRYKFE